jgi:hypothetical protein
VTQGDGGTDRIPDAALARVVLLLDEAATSWRRAAHASVPNFAATPSVPVRPDRIELAVFMALASTYGPAIVEDARFLPVVDYAVERGGFNRSSQHL